MANNTTELSSTSPKDYTLFNTVLLSFQIILIFITIGGNALTICAIFRFKTLRYPSNVMIAALAVSDLLIGLVYTPIILLRTHLPFLFMNETPCLTIMFIGKIIAIDNIIFQAFLSIERCYAIQFPYRYHSNVTIIHNVIWCLAVAGVSICMILPVICGIHVWSDNSICYAPTLFHNAFSRFYIGTFLSFQLLGLVAFLRVLVAELTLRRQDHSLQMTDIQKQDSVRSTLMVMAYGISFCLYMPHIFYYLWGTFSKKPYDPVTLDILQLLDQCSSFVNCFIYGLKNKNFRKAYKSILGYKTSQVEPQRSVKDNITG